MNIEFQKRAYIKAERRENIVGFIVVVESSDAAEKRDLIVIFVTVNIRCPIDDMAQLVTAIIAGVMYEEAEEEAGRLRRSIRQRTAAIRRRTERRRAILACLAELVSLCSHHTLFSPNFHKNAISFCRISVNC